MKWVYEIGYHFARMPYDTGPADSLRELVESGRLTPGRAIDLGCGTGRHALFLAQNGFTVTGVDFTTSGIAEARRRAESAGVQVEYLVDDLTNLQQVNGTFDLLVDIGTLDSFPRKKRQHYVQNVTPLAHPGGLFLISGWEWSRRWWEKLFLPSIALEPGEVEQRFGDTFSVDRVFHETNPNSRGPGYFTGRQKPPGFATYLLTRLAEKQPELL